MLEEIAFLKDNLSAKASIAGGEISKYKAEVADLREQLRVTKILCMNTTT